MKYLVCLVIDEAHRAMGNFSYCVAVREVCFSFFFFFSKSLLYFNLSGIQALLKDVFLDTVTGLRY